MSEQPSEIPTATPDASSTNSNPGNSEKSWNRAKTVELVQTTERLSNIISPYFVVLVGLYLYGNNGLVGTLLILTGILSLLKVSYTDIFQFFEKLQLVEKIQALLRSRK